MANQQLSTAAKRAARESWAFAVVQQLVEQIGDEPARPGASGLDEDAVRTIAREEAQAAARMVARDMAMVSSDVVERDDEGRVAAVVRVKKSGRSERYRVRRDSAGRVAGIERE